MRVFLSWSGEQSHKVALVLKEWLPNVIQALDTWVSSADIEKGEAWFAAISDSLVKSEGVGVFCLTEDNLAAPWLAFEAGALAVHDRGRVATFLFGVKPNEVVFPLGLFQGTKAESREDVFLLLKSLNARVSTHKLSDGRLQTAFDTHWPALESQLAAIPAAKADLKTKRDDPSPILNEILAVVRRIERDASRRPDPDPSWFGSYAPLSPQSGPGLLGDAVDRQLLKKALKDARSENLRDALSSVAEMEKWKEMISTSEVEKLRGLLSSQGETEKLRGLLSHHSEAEELAKQVKELDSASLDKLSKKGLLG